MFIKFMSYNAVVASTWVVSLFGILHAVSYLKCVINLKQLSSCPTYGRI